MENKVENLYTFKNRNGFPMIRRCFNCIFWNSQTQLPDNLKLGYCTNESLYFSFTLAPSAYAITKEFFLCEKHKFNNEEKLEQVCEKVLMKDIIKKKDEIV